MKKIIPTLALSLSVSAQAIDLSNLVTTSQSIVDTFDNGIMRVSGMAALAGQGGIAEAGTVDPAKLSYDQAHAYNQALSDTSNAVYTMSAEEYVSGQVENAHTEMNTAISAYVGAAQVLITAVVVNDMASDAEESQDATQAQEVQVYIADNDVEISDTHVDTYNDSLDAVEESAQVFAAFTAVQNDSELMTEMQTTVDNAGEDFLNAGMATFDAMTGDASVAFNTSNLVMSYNMLGSYVTVTDILAAGETGDFYTTGPTYNNCFFSQTQEEYEACESNI